ncbi:unnamed protein product [Heterobilharzia americana]|nr:unnamed protein product [Heterobilharzia americana]
MDKCLSLNIDNLQVNMYIEMDSNNPSMLTSQTLREKLKKLVYEATGAKLTIPQTVSPLRLLPAHRHRRLRCLTNVINSSSMNNSSGCNLTSNTNSSQHIVTTLDHIHIYGSVNSVLQARQLIMNLLPVVLTLNVNTSEGEWLESLDFKDLCHHHDINIIIRDKRRKSVKSVVIRTTEKNICSLYFVCRLIGRLLLYHSKLIGSQAGSSNCLASVTDQPKSDKLWGINMFKSDILAEIQSFSNSTEDRKLVCDSKVNSEQLILRSPITLSSLSNQSTNSFFTSNTNNNNNSGSSYNNNNQFTTQKADACYRADYLRLMSYIMNTKLELTSYCNNMIRNQYEGLNENPIAQTKEIGVDDQLSTQLTNMPVNDEIQKGYEIPPRML